MNYITDMVYIYDLYPTSLNTNEFVEGRLGKSMR